MLVQINEAQCLNLNQSLGHGVLNILSGHRMHSEDCLYIMTSLTWRITSRASLLFYRFFKEHSLLGAWAKLFSFQHFLFSFTPCLTSCVLRWITALPKCFQYGNRITLTVFITLKAVLTFRSHEKSFLAVPLCSPTWELPSSIMKGSFLKYPLPKVTSQHN